MLTNHWLLSKQKSKELNLIQLREVVSGIKTCRQLENLNKTNKIRRLNVEESPDHSGLIRLWYKGIPKLELDFFRILTY